MKRINTLMGASLLSLTAVAVIASPVFAWHPDGSIVKQVQNVSQGSQLADANTAEDAVLVQPGDTLKYVITVKNDGKYDRRGWNDMHYTKVTDQLPVGIELVDGQTDKYIGHVKAGKSSSYEFTVKVTSQHDGQVICNTAKFTGDSEVKDQPQKGQDDACVEVDIPVKPQEPETPKTPEEPKKPETPAELPKTGLANALTNTLGLAAVTTASLSFIRSRR